MAIMNEIMRLALVGLVELTEERSGRCIMIRNSPNGGVDAA